MSDSSDEVVILNLQVLASLCSSEGEPQNRHFRLFLLSLLRLFSADRNLLDTKGSFIIRCPIL
jgi:vacuole morphology and inheritance protein 14